MKLIKKAPFLRKYRVNQNPIEAFNEFHQESMKNNKIKHDSIGQDKNIKHMKRSLHKKESNKLNSRNSKLQVVNLRIYFELIIWPNTTNSMAN